MKSNEEYQNFDRTMRDLMKVTHSTVKAKLNAEKRAKQKRKARPSASARDYREKD
jgi:hypothetical protein